MQPQQPGSARPCTIKELAALYSVTPKVIKIWLKPHAPAIGPKSGRYYTLLQVRKIFALLGEP